MQNRSAAGVCSWSLQAGTVDELAAKVLASGVAGVQLALDPVRNGVMPIAEVKSLPDRGVAIYSGMMGMLGEDYSTLETIRETGGIVPDATWESNLAAARSNAAVARELGMKLVTFHAGFVPHDDDARRGVLVERLRALAEVFGDAGVGVALETGQEDAATLRALLDELRAHADVGVNFDPANMILYGMGDPVEAVPVLARFIKQVHVKDAVASSTPGEWGSEVPVGAGDVRWYEFFRALRENDVQCDMMIEREAGAQRVEDVRAALALLKQERVV